MNGRAAKTRMFNWADRAAFPSNIARTPWYAGREARCLPRGQAVGQLGRGRQIGGAKSAAARTMRGEDRTACRARRLAKVAALTEGMVKAVFVTKRKGVQAVVL